MSMRLKLWHRWSLLAAGLVLLALVAMGVSQQRAFRDGLLAHAAELERGRLPAVAERLAVEYRSAGGWQRLVAEPHRWRQAVLGEERAGPPPPGPPPHRGPSQGPPPPRGPPPHRPRPPDDAPLGALGPGFGQRLTLIDAEGRIVRGPTPSPEAARANVVVDGRAIGALALAPLPALAQVADLEFAAQQRRTALAIGLLVIAASVLAAFAMSRRMLARLGRLAEASRRLAAGDRGARAGDLGRDEIGELAQDFDRMAESLERNRAARDRWIADISHELRTPLTILRGELAALEDGIRPLDRAALTSLAREAERLSDRIDDLHALAVSDVGGLAYRFESVDLAALVREAVDAHREILERVPLALDVRLPSSLPVARADDRRLRQLLDNLLDNCVRYTDPGGRVRVELGRSDGRTVDLVVEDSAPGVPADTLPRLLERHYRADPARGHGSGLGLAIVRNIVEAHGGSIVLDASALGGVRIHVRLPATGDPP
jgi:two-component system sensor histidine kinase BaeS